MGSREGVLSVHMSIDDCPCNNGFFCALCMEYIDSVVNEGSGLLCNIEVSHCSTITY